MKKFLPWLALFALVIPCVAQAQSGHGNPLNAPEVRQGAPQMIWEPLTFRRTKANPSTVGDNWAKGGGAAGQSNLSYDDSLVFRKASSTRTLVDTTVAYRIGDWGMPPSFYAHGAAYGARAMKNQSAAGPSTGTVDSVVVDTTDSSPWIVIRVSEDTLSYGGAAGTGGYTGGTSLDSAFVGAQVSPDGLNWYAVNGTPTRAFIANPTGVSGGDGIAIPSIEGLAEWSPGIDVVYLPAFQCQPSTYTGAAPILNRNLCSFGGWYVRFIIGVNDGVGQFKAEYAHW